MGHIQYQRSYRNESFLFREGANPGFHEGVADVISLAVGNQAFLIIQENFWVHNF